MLVRQWAQIIDAQDVIGVCMGIKHGIELGNLFAQGLFAEVGRGVDQYIPIVVADHYRRASAPVARI
jgi:hypothetical protein